MEDKIQHSKPVPPFVRFCSANIPMVFDDSLSYYECLCALWKFIQDDVIDVINNNATVTQKWREELTEFEDDMTDKFGDLSDEFDTLKTWVETYFDNLDVQEEINNKLDEMAEDGTLAQLLNNYSKIYIDAYEGYCTDVTVEGTTYKNWLPAFEQALSENKVIYLRRATYYIDDTLDIDKSGFSINGDSKWKSVIQLIPTSEISGNGIIQLNENHITLSNLHIKGNDEGDVDEKCAIYTVGGDGAKSTNALIENVSITHIKGDGIQTETHTYDARFNNLTIYYVNNGIVHNSTDCYFNNIIVNQCLNDGIDLIGSSNSLSQCKVYQTGKLNAEEFVETTGYGFLISGATNYLDNCQAQECGYDGFKVSGDGNIIAECTSDSNGRYINTATGFNINANWCRVTGEAVNKYLLNTGLDWGMPTGVNLSGVGNYINVNVYNIDNVDFTKYFVNDCTFTNDLSNTIIINGSNRQIPDYTNNLDRGKTSNVNVPLDFTGATSGSANPVYKVDSTNHYCSIKIVNAANNSNSKFVYTNTLIAGQYGNISLYVEKIDDTKNNTSSFIRIRFYDDQDAQISMKAFYYAEYYNLHYNSRLGWNPCFGNTEIPATAVKFEIELVNSATAASVTNETKFRNLKYMMF